MFYKKYDVAVQKDREKELGEKIKRLRKQKGYAQEQFAEMIDISSRNVSNIEQGISFPKPETLEKIIKSFDITVEKLFITDHIKSRQELLENIYTYINKIENDDHKLEIVYKILRDLLEN